MKGIGGDHSFLTRLRRDTRGNTIALVAAALIPLAGMIGGAVDMSRLYLTKTRLQQACDAGALAGRKVMATDAWTTGDNSAEARAKDMFNANFAEGAYGTGALLREFKEEDGTVTGTATVAVPMTLMRIFGMTQRTLDISCTAKMEIPNTDVMFVLDVTGSMAGSRINGLKSAVKCFYEALVKVATPEKCDGGNGSTDPQGTSYTGTAQIRLGFVPYAVNVNVGKLLPNEYLADSWNYQTREATVTSVQAWTLGNESAISGWGNWSSAPTNLQNADSYSGWGSVAGSGSVTINGQSYAKQRTGMNSTSCANLNVVGTGNNRMLGYQDSANIQDPSVQNTTNNPPTHPATQQVINYTQSDDHTVIGYRYIWASSGRSNVCQLQSATRSYSLTRSGGQSTRPITWKQYDDVIQSWTYKKMALPQIAALKAGGSSWNNSVSLPIGQIRGDTVKLSGSNASTTLQLRTNVDVTWDGCLEEQQTFQTNNADPINDWNPVPAQALDMDINLIPSTSKPGSFWGPMLRGAVWGRHTGSGNNAKRYLNQLTTSDNLDQNKFVTYSCPTPARKLAEYNTVGDLVSYINSFTASGNTYHDSGMIWGARLLSPTGIFASENQETPKGGAIQRHLIFMTDGNAETAHDYYTSFGLSYWDRRQTTYDPSVNQTNSLVKGRLSALCTKIKNMNITLWVISYGGGVNTENEDRLKACATSGHYYSASNSEALMARFKQIAAEIAELRLIS